MAGETVIKTTHTTANRATTQLLVHNDCFTCVIDLCFQRGCIAPHLRQFISADGAGAQPIRHRAVDNTDCSLRSKIVYFLLHLLIVRTHWLKYTLSSIVKRHFDVWKTRLVRQARKFRATHHLIRSSIIGHFTQSWLPACADHHF